MGDALKKRLRQAGFRSPAQEALLNLIVTTAHLTGKLDAVCDRHGISHQQYNILRILNGVYPAGHPCGEIAQRMLDRSPDVTRRLDGLAGKGLVERYRPREDRRVVMTRITEAGIELLRRIDPEIESIYTHIGRKLPAGDCHELSRLCEKLYQDEL
jgi:DNA-binding MarR family transcriptional regulator